ncbi:MAG: CHAD domain-containing protein [Acidobacteriota bacterium]
MSSPRDAAAARPGLPQSFRAADAEVAAAALEGATKGLRRADQSRQILRQWLDSFDGLLASDGLELRFDRAPTAKKGDLVLSELAVKEGSPLVRTLRAFPRPAWPQEVPAGPVRSAIAEPLGPRLLLPWVEVERDELEVRILDELDKTVARLVWVKARARGVPCAAFSKVAEEQELPGRIEVHAIKGFEGAARRLELRLEAQGLEPSPHDERSLALAAVGLPLAAVSGGPLSFDEQEPAGRALRRLLLAQRAVVEANEPGVRQRLDIEFLHDFRVAVRRSRSALSQLKGLLPEALAATLRRELKWLGGITGPARDLDVYQDKLPAYGKRLPATDAAGLQGLQGFLAELRDQEQERLVAALDSERYRALMEVWGSLEAVDDEAPESPAAAREAIGPRVCGRIRKLLRRVLRDGRAIRPETPAEAVHDLRIECKKLRYSMELFRTLFDPRQLTSFIKQLKRLQDNLGDFNDYEVQQVQLRTMAHQMSPQASSEGQGEDASAVDTYLALGRLMAFLDRAQQRERQRFHQRFEAFDQPPVRAAAERLFGSLGSAVSSAQPLKKTAKKASKKSVKKKAKKSPEKGRRKAKGKG